MTLSLFNSRYAIRDGNKIKIFKNFKERKSFKPEYGAESKFLCYLSLSSTFDPLPRSRLLKVINCVFGGLNVKVRWLWQQDKTWPTVTLVARLAN